VGWPGSKCFLGLAKHGILGIQTGKIPAAAGSIEIPRRLQTSQTFDRLMSGLVRRPWKYNMKSLQIEYALKLLPVEEYHKVTTDSRPRGLPGLAASSPPRGRREPVRTDPSCLSLRRRVIDRPDLLDRPCYAI
jgi:hypothetical protein